MTQVNDASVPGCKVLWMNQHCSPVAPSLVGHFDRFAEVILPAEVSPGVVEQLRALAHSVHVAPGESACLDGGTATTIFLLEGAAKLVGHASARREQIASFHFAGDLVAVPAQGAHPYSLVALEPAELLVLPEADFLALASREPPLVGEVLARLLVSLGRCREKSIALGRKTASERVAGFLVAMSERIGNRDGVGCTMQLPMPRRDIADSLGLTVETVSRQFSELKAAGLIETVGRAGVRVPDPAALSACAGYLEFGA